MSMWDAQPSQRRPRLFVPRAPQAGAGVRFDDEHAIGAWMPRNDPLVEALGRDHATLIREHRAVLSVQLRESK
jgi:hypothetical protein